MGFRTGVRLPSAPLLRNLENIVFMGGFREFGKVGIGRFRPKKTSLNHTNWGIIGV